MVLVSAPLCEAAAKVNPNNLPQLHADVSAHPSTLKASYSTSGGGTEVVRDSERATVGAGKVLKGDGVDWQMGKGCPVQLHLWRAMP